MTECPRCNGTGIYEPKGRTLLERAKNYLRDEGWKIEGNGNPNYRVSQLHDRQHLTRDQLIEFAGIKPDA